MKMQRRYLAMVVTVAGLMSSEALVHAQAKTEIRMSAGEKMGTTAPLDPCVEQPWYCGVSRDDRERAEALYEEANQLFDDGLLEPATDKYREALALWDHPAIHYNIMLALTALDQPIEAYKSSLAALRYGKRGLQPEEYHRAQDYRHLLRGRVAKLKVVCDEPGALVTLDGKRLFVGPGSAELLLLPGQHEVVASKTDYLTTNRAFLLESREPLTVELRMLPRDEAVLVKQPWASWKPWTVVGTGAGLALAGAALQWRSSVNNRRFSEAFVEECPSGCLSYDSEARAAYQRYTWYRRTSYGAYIAGGVMTLTGLVLVYLNWPMSEDNPQRDNLVNISVTPQIAPSSGGLLMNIDF